MIGGIDAGSWSAFVAFLLPQLGKLFEAKDYATAFNTTALLPVVGVVIWWMVTPRLRSN